MLGKLSGEFRHFGGCPGNRGNRGCPGNRKPPETPETRPGNPSLVWVVLAGNLPPGSHHPLPSPAGWQKNGVDEEDDTASCYHDCPEKRRTRGYRPYLLSDFCGKL